MSALERGWHHWPLSYSVLHHGILGAFCCLPRQPKMRRLLPVHCPQPQMLSSEGCRCPSFACRCITPPPHACRFYQPHRESGSASPLYYSYEVAGLHVVMAGSYTAYDKGSEQYAWLEGDLASVDR